MLADDAEIDEEIERQLEADAQDRNFLEQPLLDEKDLDVKAQKKTKIQYYFVNFIQFINDETTRYFPLTKQLSLPPNFTFHSTNSPTTRRAKSNSIHGDLF